MGEHTKTEIDYITEKEAVMAYKSRCLRGSAWMRILEEFSESKKPVMRIKNRHLGQFKPHLAKFPTLFAFGKGKDVYIVNKKLVDVEKTWLSDITAE